MWLAIAIGGLVLFLLFSFYGPCAFFGHKWKHVSWDEDGIRGQYQVIQHLQCKRCKRTTIKVFHRCLK
jgi:hypothetical protein